MPKWPRSLTIWATVCRAIARPKKEKIIPIGMRSSAISTTPGPGHPGFDFPDSLMDRLARQTARAADETYASATQSFGFVRRGQAARAFIQMRPDGAKLRPKLGKSTHS